MFRRWFGKDTEAGANDDPQPSVAAIQDDIIRRIVADRTSLHDGDWEDRDFVHLAVNHELLVKVGRRSSTQAVVLARRPGGELESLGFRLDAATKEALLTLCEAMARDGRGYWTIADIAIEMDGRYAFSFGYGDPPRISGNLLHAPLKNLLARYKAEHGLT